MLNLKGIDIKDNLIELSTPSEVVINQEEGVPADDITLTIPFTEDLPELYMILVENNGQVAFKGLVDEQQTIVNKTGAWVKIVARSMASLLLDNESKPVSYLNPSSDVIVDRHLSQYGLGKCVGENRVYSGTFDVQKGSTQWQVLNSFCKKVYGTSPRIEGDGTVRLNGIDTDNSVEFSDSEVDYISLKENIKRHKLLSGVYVKTADLNDYNTFVKNQQIVDRKIQRFRYIDSSYNNGLIAVADSMLSSSNNNGYEITVKCNGCFINMLGYGAVVKSSVIGERENLYISSISYRLSSQGEYTTLILKRRN